MSEGRKLAIATKHHKETVLAPLLEQHLGVICFVPVQLDTDTLGTFTGEVARTSDPVSVARQKCLMAMELTGCDLAVASEGSFGPHPSLPFLPADDEVLLFVDKKNNLEIAARELSTQTNYSSEILYCEEQLINFANRIGFPSHGIILRKSGESCDDIIKGLTNWTLLREAFNTLLYKYTEVYAETDMRALYNPTRMSVIAKAAEKLVRKLNTLCPSCQSPGFDVTDMRSGLPCQLCGTPTRSPLSYIHSCQKCRFTEEQKYPFQKLAEDPMYCDFCNP